MQVPAILQNKKKIKTKIVKPEFNHAELQQISSQLRKSLRDLNFFKTITKIEITEAWDKSVPGTVEGESSYHKLNDLKNAFKSMRQDEEKLMNIQRKLKKMLT